MVLHLALVKVLEAQGTGGSGAAVAEAGLRALNILATDGSNKLRLVEAGVLKGKLRTAPHTDK